LETEVEREAVEVINTELVFPTHANHYGTIFGGRVLELMDLTAALAAMRFAKEDAVTASIDAVDFKKPIKVGDIMELKAKVINTGRTSMVVRVEVYRVGKFHSRRDSTCVGYLVFVAVGANGEPREVPKLKLVTDEDKKYWDIGERIRQRSKERKKREEVE